MSGIVRALAGLAVVTSLLGACAGTSRAQSESPGPVTLTLTTYDDVGTPGAALVNRFVDELRALDPGVRVTVRLHGSPTEADAVRSVSDGSADLVMVASRAFDTAGVTSLQALNTPLLIDSTALARAVASSDLVPELLAGLDTIGVEGLALAPEGMRHVFGRESAPVDVRDLRGQTVRSPQSQTVWAFFAQLGATPIFDETRPYRFAESQFDQSPLDRAAGNLTLFAKYDVIGINADAARTLPEERLRSLRVAATRAAEWAAATVASDVDMAKSFCDNGGEIVLATDEQVERWRAAADVVVADLRAVPTTSRLIDAITTLKGKLSPTPAVASCSGPPKASNAPPRLDGTYTFSVTPQALADVGIHDQPFIEENAGDYTVTLRQGVLQRTQRYTVGTKAGTTSSSTHRYTLDGDTITIRWSAQPGDFTTAKVSVQPDGSLSFSDWVEGEADPKFLLQDQVTLKTWKRVSPP